MYCDVHSTGMISATVCMYVCFFDLEITSYVTKKPVIKISLLVMVMINRLEYTRETNQFIYTVEL